jgi:hypothetical protein
MLPIVLVSLGLLAIVIACIVCERRKHESFKLRSPPISDDERFPPISDDEFVARCGPNTNREIALRVRRIVADQFGAEYDRISPETSFVDDLGAD